MDKRFWSHLLSNNKTVMVSFVAALLSDITVFKLPVIYKVTFWSLLISFLVQLYESRTKISIKFRCDEPAEDKQVVVRLTDKSTKNITIIVTYDQTSRFINKKHLYIRIPDSISITGDGEYEEQLIENNSITINLKKREPKTEFELKFVIALQENRPDGFTEFVTVNTDIRLRNFKPSNELKIIGE